jgi:tol-pal system protein YbgF
MKKISSILVSSILSLSIAFPALAQDYAESGLDGSRIEKLEHDLQLLQRQISRSPSGNPAAGGGVGNADLEVRLSAIEAQMRELVGRTEEIDFKAKKNTENLDKLQRDIDFRFNDLAKTQAANAQATAAQTVAKDAAKPAATDNKDKNGKSVGKTVDTVDETATATATDIDTKTPDQTEFASPREQYNYAFRLLNQTQYDKAAASFEDFTKKYPKDPLVGNAFYWLGETFYIRRDYVSAADSFRQGFESMPTGSKAPDNLLKLAMTLNALKRDKESCVVLGQIITKFKKTAATVSQKAEAEQKRITCEQ